VALGRKKGTQNTSREKKEERLHDWKGAIGKNIGVKGGLTWEGKKCGKEKGAQGKCDSG